MILIKGMGQRSRGVAFVEYRWNDAPEANRFRDKASFA